MSNTQHHYSCTVTWTGNTGPGTVSYTGYERDHRITHTSKSAIRGSSDPAFRGDPSAWNPEELLVASLSQCHMLFFLHLAAKSGVIVESYQDSPVGTMTEDGNGGAFTEVVLRPNVVVSSSGTADACEHLHAQAHERCYIANSVNFVVRHKPTMSTPPQPPHPPGGRS